MRMSYNQVVTNYITWVVVVCLMHTPSALGPSCALGVYIRQTVHARDGIIQGAGQCITPNVSRYHNTSLLIK